jgi:citrate lyase beta subunit
MIVAVLNSARNTHKMAGVRIHDHSHPHWRKGIDILVGGAGKVLAYVTIPKSTSERDAAEMVAYIRESAIGRRSAAPFPSTSSSRRTGPSTTRGSSRCCRACRSSTSG